MKHEPEPLEELLAEVSSVSMNLPMQQSPPALVTPWSSSC